MLNQTAHESARTGKGAVVSRSGMISLRFRDVTKTRKIRNLHAKSSVRRGKTNLQVSTL